MKPGLESFGLALFVGFATASCSNQGDLDSESHFACTADPDCEAGNRCVANACKPSPGVPGHGRIEDAVDPRSATTPNCAEESCVGGLQGMYTARPPDGLQWRWGGLPLFGVAPNGTIILSFEESDVSGANPIPVVRRLTPELEEISTTRLSSLEGLNGALYVDDGGFARVDSIYAEGQPGTLKIQTFDSEMQPRAHRDVQLPLGTWAQRVSSSGDIMLRGSSMGSTLNAAPVPPPLEGCPEIESVFKMSADGKLSPLLCFRGLSIVMFDDSPSGFAAYGTVKGPPSETRSIDFGEGAIDAAGESTILVRYDIYAWCGLPRSSPQVTLS
jgi:hypothetical protein